MPIVTGLNANVFRAVSGSLFSSPGNWSRGYVPTGSDVVIVSDNCTIDISRTIGTLVVRPGFTASINTGLILQVNDVINVMGHLSCSGNPNIISFATKNIINSLSPGTSTFTYTGSRQQSVAGGPYYNLTILGNAIRKSNANLFTSGAVLINQFANLDLGPYDLDALSTVFMGAQSIGDGTLTKSQPGSIKIGGSLTIDTHANNVKGLDLSGNPTIELKGGVYVFNQSLQAYTGMGLLRFTTNNQSINTSYSALTFYNPILISGSIAVSCSSGASIYLNNTISSVDSSSILYNAGNLYFNYAPSYDLITGSLNITSSVGNTVGYIFNGNATLPYTTYQNLRVYSIGTKTLKGNTIISGSLYVYNGYGDNINNTILELSSSNLIVSGTTNIGTTNNRGTLSRLYNGTTTFLGPVSVDISNTNGPGIDFSASNADIEFRNGIGLYDISSRIRTGTGSWYFTTNNQTLTSAVATTLDSKLIISGAITLTSSFAGLSVTNIINGTDPNSKFLNRGTLYFATSASLNGSLTTGSYDFTSSINTVVVGGNYNGTIPARFSSSFYNLSISGTGTKTLGTSSFVSNTLSITSNSYLNMSSSNLTVSGTLNIATGLSQFSTMSLGTGNLYVSGTTLIWRDSKIITSVSNNVIFNGLVDFRDYGNTDLIDFSSGAPNVELRNGLSTNQGNFPGPMRSGFGTWSFTTNNQTITGNGHFSFTGSTIVSGAITVSNRAATNVYYSLNGTDANSKFENYTGATLGVYTTSSLMTTGILDIKTYPNTLYYGMTGDYILPYQSYRNLQVYGGSKKSINQNTDITGSLFVGTNSAFTTFDLSSYNLFVSGTTSVINASLTKSGSGNIIFNDLVTFWDYGSIYIVDFSLGNPNVEFRNGLYATNQGSALGSINSGTGSWVFSTNNQSLYGAGVGYGVTIKAPITISGPITFTVNLTPTFSGSINGDNTNSKLLMATNSTIYYANSVTPMSTGILDVTSSLGTTFVYNSGSQNIRGGTYRNLTFLNGLKTLQGNVSVLGAFSTGSGATSGSYNLNGFTLTNP